MNRVTIDLPEDVKRIMVKIPRAGQTTIGAVIDTGNYENVLVDGSHIWCLSSSEESPKPKPVESVTNGAYMVVKARQQSEIDKANKFYDDVKNVLLFKGFLTVAKLKQIVSFYPQEVELFSLEQHDHPEQKDDEIGWDEVPYYDGHYASDAILYKLKKTKEVKE